MGFNGSKSFSVLFETKMLQAKTNCPWPSVHNLGIWATVKKLKDDDVGVGDGNDGMVV